MSDEKIICDDEGPELGGKCTLMFDDDSNAMGHGIGAVLMSPKNYHFTFTAKLCFDCKTTLLNTKLSYWDSKSQLT